MARRPSGERPSARPSRRRPTAARPAPAAAAPADQSVRSRIIAAFMALLAEKPIETIGLSEIAAGAEVSLAELRTEFGSKFAILAAEMKEIDRRVLAGTAGDMAEESPRERLFDVLMRRLDILSAHKEAVRSLMRSARRHPPLALMMNKLAVRSQQWMLAAADLDAAGPRGMIRAQGLALSFAQVLRTWIDDDDPGLARTMAMLDRELARGQRWVGFLDDLCRLVPRCPSLRRRRRDYEEDEGGEPAAAV